jgi:hypothetical protein
MAAQWPDKETIMGNRAVITVAPYSESNVGIYVHWNGGRASVEGFMKAARELGYRDPAADSSYAMARLAQAIGQYFGGSTSLGIGVVRGLDTDNGDNGVYVIGEGWEIVGRKFADAKHDEVDASMTDAIAAQIVAKVRAGEGAAA